MVWFFSEACEKCRPASKTIKKRKMNNIYCAAAVCSVELNISIYINGLGFLFVSS